MYLKGLLGVEKDRAEARRWYSLAAEQGWQKAQYNLALMYKKGHGGPKDYVQAYMWLLLAEAQGSSLEIRHHLRWVGRKMTAVDVARAEELATAAPARPAGDAQR